MRRLLALLAFTAAACLVPVGAAAHAVTDFTLSADFVGLYPNANVDIPVTVHNPQSYAIAVHAASMVIGDASPTCTAANVSAQNFSGDVTVPAGGTATFPIRMHMYASAPDACQGATFPLTFTASGASLAAGSRDGGLSGFAFTGAEPVPLAVVGGVAVALGAVLLRRRRSHAVRHDAPSETAAA